jgi:hypothetical protein
MQYEPLKAGTKEHARFHSSLRDKRGFAGRFLCEGGCGGRAKEWAWVHDRDPRDMGSYVPLCVACHRHYDRPGRTVWATCKHCDVELTDENRSKGRKHSCKECAAALWRKWWQDRHS